MPKKIARNPRFVAGTDTSGSEQDNMCSASPEFIARANNPFGTPPLPTKSGTSNDSADPHGTGTVSTRIRFVRSPINGTASVARKRKKEKQPTTARIFVRPKYRSTRAIIDEIDRELQAMGMPVRRKPGRPRKNGGTIDSSRTPGMSKPVSLATQRAYARIVRTALKDVPAASKLSSTVKQRLVQGLVDEMCFALESLAKKEVLIYGARGPKPKLLQVDLLAGVNHQFQTAGVKLKEWVGGGSSPTELTSFCEDLLKGMKIDGLFFSSRQVQASRKEQVYSLS